MTDKTDNSRRFWTIPNMLTILRFAMIPVIVWLYVVKKAYYPAAVVVGLSGLTDVVDGIVARRFNMVTDIGKIIDPIADKLTQLAVITCLALRYSPMRVLLAAHVIKELIMGIMGLMALKRNSINSAKWYGKVSTIVLFCVTAIHLIFPGIPHQASVALVTVSLVVMAGALALYIRFYYNLLHHKD